MNKGVLILLIAALSLSTLTGCSNPFAKDTTTSSEQEEVNVDEIKEQVRTEMEEENKKQQEQEDKIKEQVKKEVEEQNANSNKDVTVNVNNDTKPDSVVIVKETIPTTAYYSNNYIFPESSTSYLSKSQVKSLSNYQLGIARNEIYARHGYIFKLDTFKRYFESQNWYVPRYSNQSSISLNKVESYNVDLIKGEEDRRGVQW
ncbi:MAG: YARHG domain-containing protein [Clostridium sp.]|nr:YARHG domain-containing protein [Clostridium sp.]